ncbi:MAG: ATP-binding cassette domain-containing protein [Proteobacteria bacterium]|nr:ATP-binding cassette domain-containing protein [Pseudomonadota bacterium]
MEKNTPVIEFAKLKFSFSDTRILFEDLSLKLNSGSFYLIRGPSGSGKSTFLRLINRLEEPSAGNIFFNGRRLASYSPPLLRRSILYIQQTPTAIDGTVRQNLLLGFTFKNNRDRTPPDDAALKTQLDNFLLSDIRLETNAQTLSVGQLQRLCFIRGLLLDPQVLLLDEPASALDEESSRIVENTAERMCAGSGLTVLMVSHRRFEPQQVKCNILQIAGGRVEEIK